MKQKNKIKGIFRFPSRIWFWILFIIVMSILFFYNRQSIAKTVTKIKADTELESPKITNTDIKKIVEGDSKKNESTKDTNTTEIDQLVENITKVEDEKAEGIKEKPNEDINEVVENAQDIAEEKEEDKELQKRDIHVYFATVNSNGMVNLEKCDRYITRTPSPMLDSIKNLLEGPTKDEAKKGFRSFIPPDTKLLSASIKDGLAIVDFSEDFQFNRYGVEGYNIQLQQVVLTVCSFPSVSSVQFLIEGQKRDFLGSDGVWIGSPFTIESF